MWFNTTWIKTGSEAQAADTAAEWAELNYTDTVVATIQDRAVAIEELTTKIIADPDGTGEELGRREDAAQPYSFATVAAGTVNGEQFGQILLDVPGMPDGLTVGVAVPPFGTPTSLRDAGSELTFGDFTNQTEYQKVAVELNNRAAEAVYSDLDPDSLQGKEVHVTGSFTWASKTGGEIDHLVITPVIMEVK